MADSLLAGLLARREEIAAEQSKLVPVPLWDKPTLHLRVHPIDTPTINRIQKTVAQAGRRHAGEAAVEGDAAIVAAATDKVLIGGDREITLRDLGVELEMPEGFSAGDVVRKLCIRDGDVHALAKAVGEVSGFAEGVDVIDEAFSGE